MFYTDRQVELLANARTATPEEHKALWPRMAEIWPHYNNYPKKTVRQIPLVILELA